MPGKFGDDDERMKRDEQDRLALERADRLAPKRPISESEKLVLETDRDYGRQGELPRKDAADIGKRLAIENAAADERAKQLFGDRYKVVDLRKTGTMGGDAWAQAANQAQARDAAHDAKQTDHYAEAGRLRGLKDDQGADVVRLQAMAEQKQYESAVWSDIKGKELSIRPDDPPRWTNEQALEFQGKANEAAQESEKIERRLDLARDLLDRRPNHEDRQDAYKDLAGFAKEQGAGRAAEFLDKYREYKQAQYEERVSHVRGTPEGKQAAWDKLDAARTAAIEAKGDLRVKEVSALAAAYRARENNPRLFTKPEAPQPAQAAQQEQQQAEKPTTRPITIGGRTVGKPYVDSRVARLQEIKADELKGPKAETDPMERIRKDRDGRTEQLKQVFGADADPAFLKSAAQREGNFRNEMSKSEAGRAVLAENAAKAEAERQAAAKKSGPSV